MSGPLPPVELAILNGESMAFQRFGDDDAPTIVLVAGGASSMDWWDADFCEQLAAGDASSGPRRVIRYDYRDTGQSVTVPPGEGRYTDRDLLDDLAALIEHLHSAPVHAVGLSMGGALVQLLALDRPDLTASITLMSTTPVTTRHLELPPPSESVSLGSPVTDWSDSAAVIDSIVASERLYSGSIPVDEARIRRIATAVVSRTSSPASADNHWSSGEGQRPEGEIDSISVPTLVMHGSEDPLFPLPHGEKLAELIPGARLVVIPGMGHQHPPPPTWPQVVGELLRHTDAGVKQRA